MLLRAYKIIKKKQHSQKKGVLFETFRLEKEEKETNIG